MENSYIADVNWEFVLKMLPSTWREDAKKTGAITRLRGIDSEGDLLRTLMLHIAHGCSLRSTSVLAKMAGWATMSDVALLNRLRASDKWLHTLCCGLLEENAMAIPTTHRGMRMRLVDGTIIKEPGSTGSQWRVLYSLSVPDWQCDFFRLTPTKGVGNGESLAYFSVEEGDCLLADRGFSQLRGIFNVHEHGASVIVRLNVNNTPLFTKENASLDLLDWLRNFSEPGQLGERDAWITVPEKKGERLPVRICAVRKSLENILLSERKLKRKASRNQSKLKPSTLELSGWIILLTTVDSEILNTEEILEWYRVRWQIELAFKRLKSLSNAGHVPKSDPASSRAWIYGKLLVALLSEKMQRHAASFSPWGAQWFD